MQIGRIYWLANLVFTTELVLESLSCSLTQFFLFILDFWYFSTNNVNLFYWLISCLQLIDISDDGFLSLMMESGELRDDIKIPEGDIGTEIKTKFENGEDLLVSHCTIFCCLWYLLVSHCTIICCLRYFTYVMNINSFSNTLNCTIIQGICVSVCLYLPFLYLLSLTCQ